MKHAIVTGASAGIGRALALKLAEEGYRVGIIARRVDRLEEIARKYPDQIVKCAVDLRKFRELPSVLDKLVSSLGGIDLVVANAGVGRHNLAIDLEPELDTVEVNVGAFVATVDWAANCFKRQGSGHIVGVSSVAAFWANSGALAYNASKAFEARYLAGLYSNLKPHGIAVTDICPGFVDTEMTAGRSNMFWVSSSEKAANQIYRAILKKKRIAYITKRWRYVGWIMRSLPFQLYTRLTVKD